MVSLKNLTDEKIQELNQDFNRRVESGDVRMAVLHYPETTDTRTHAEKMRGMAVCAQQALQL